MHDKPLATELERASPPEGKGLLDAAFDPGNAACEQVKAIRPDSRSNQALENSGALPRIELLDPGAANQGDWKGLPSDGSAFLETKSGDVGTTRSNFSEFSLVESGMKVKEVPGPDGDKTTYYDTGAVRWEFAGWTVETRNGMTIVEANNNITLTLPDGTELQRHPREPNPGVKSTEVDDDGNVKYKYTDGSEEWIKTDGTRVEGRENGLAIIEWPDHSVAVKLPDGTWLDQRSPKDGNSGVAGTEVTDDGQVTYKYKDGEYDVISTDGTRYTFDKDGAPKEIYWPNGGYLVYGADDKTYTTTPEGHLIVEDKDGRTSEEDENGKIIKPKHHTHKTKE